MKRTWPIGADPGVLKRRWRILVETPASERDEMMKETRDRKVAQRVRPLLKQGGTKLAPLNSLSRDARPEGIERYAYRSFDRQWLIADNRLADFPRPDLWAVRSDRQVFFTTLTSTPLGRGPVVTATPYVPDLHHFSGRGAKDVIPLWRDAVGTVPNMPRDLIRMLSIQLGDLTPEDFAAYVYALLGTGAFADRFADELGEGAGPVHVPVTADAQTFRDGVELGRRLLHLHTWGERFENGATVPAADEAVEIAPVEGYPDSFSYDPVARELRVGTGRFGPVPPEVWEFEVSGLRPVSSWLGYRMANRKGKKSSPLDDITPEAWSFSRELVELLNVISQTVDLTPLAAELLKRIVSGPLIDGASLPAATDAERKPPT